MLQVAKEKETKKYHYKPNMAKMAIDSVNRGKEK